MGENTKISWADHSFNPWTGCTKVSLGCDHCYAESWAKRSGLVEWGKGKPRRRTSEANWKKPPQWDRKAAKLGIRYRVFSASLADVFDPEVPEEWRWDMWDLIDDTKNLDWLLLTKRPENFTRFLPTNSTYTLPNLWLGVTAENQEQADKRIPILLDTPAAMRFVSMEPLIGRNPIHLLSGLDWIIAGCESGSRARPMDLEAVEDIRRHCEMNRIPFFYKQAMIDGHLDYAPRLDGKLYQEFPG